MQIRGPALKPGNKINEQLSAALSTWRCLLLFALPVSISCGLTSKDPQREPGNNGKAANNTVENAASCAKYDAEKRASIPACANTGAKNADPVVVVPGLAENQEVQAMGNYALINLKAKPPAEATVGEVFASADNDAPIPTQYVKVDYNAALFCLFLPPSLVTGKYTVNFVAQGTQKGTSGIHRFSVPGQYATVTINYKSEYGTDKATLKSECPDTKESSFLQANSSSSQETTAPASQKEE